MEAHPELVVRKIPPDCQCERHNLASFTIEIDSHGIIVIRSYGPDDEYVRDFALPLESLPDLIAALTEAALLFQR